jgi:hydroxymethylpyrimidine pyrophosphatase-like HAD family hydrolase
MKFSVLALDYDGIYRARWTRGSRGSRGDREARSRQIVIALVTGRILSDLQRVLAEQGLFDVIVAENGAVLVFPSGRTRLLGRPPPQAFLDELCRLEVAFKNRGMRSRSRRICGTEDSGRGAESRATANARIQSQPRDGPAVSD